ncbi:MAG: recombination-associated protein RdgC [Desulfovibrio sp.]|nr:recombination-associated protein RdgC [Desulfovibrio sp.]
MAFLTSSSSFTRFRVIDAIPEEFWPKVPELLKKYAFHDIDDIPEERSFGWVCFDDMLDTEWRTAQPYKGEYIVFSLRLDTRRIPAGVIKKHLTLAVREELQRLAQFNKKFIARERKKEIKEQVILRLRQRFLPVPAEFNVIWSIKKNEIWFASTQGKMIDLFMDYFQQSFELNLEQITPSILAEVMLDESSLAGLDTLEETRFALDPGA